MITLPKPNRSLPLLLIVWLGFALRVSRLSFQPLWWDEGWSFYFTAQSWPQLLDLTANNIHPPLYYLLLKGWLMLLGETPEVARLFSVMVNLLLIPVMGQLGRRLGNRSVGNMAALLTALMPISIYYAHEVRMYSLVTLLAALSTLCFICVVNDGAKQANLNAYRVAYVLTTTAALYTMYYAAFVPLFHLVYVVMRGTYSIVSTPRTTHCALRTIYHHLTLLIVTGLLYLPWLIYATPRLIAYIANKQHVEQYPPLSLIQFLTDHAIAFSLGYLPPELGFYSSVSLFFAALAFYGAITMGRPIKVCQNRRDIWSATALAVATFWRQINLSHPKILKGNSPSHWEGDKRRAGSLVITRANRFSWLLPCYLLIPVSLGYVINQIAPFTPPTYQRTLLLAAPAYWLLMAFGLTALRQRHRWLANGLLSLMLGCTVINLMRFYRLPRYTEADYRPLLTDIAARSTPQDTVIASYQWQVGFYHAYLPAPRPKIFTVPQWGAAWQADATGARPAMRQALTQLTQQSPRLWFPAHQIAGHIWEEAAETVMADIGYPAQLTWHGPQTKLTLIRGQVEGLSSGPTANFGQRLRLIDSRAGLERSYQAGRGIIPISLTWQRLQSLEADYQINLRLTDERGYIWAVRDSHPHAGQSRLSELLSGQNLTDRHGLLVQAGTPPGHYQLKLSLRRVSDAHPLDMVDELGHAIGVDLLLGKIEVVDPQPSLDPAALPIKTQAPLKLTAAIKLLGFTLPDGPFKAGERVPLTLFWQAIAPPAAAYTLRFDLMDAAGQPLLTIDQPPLRPTNRWPPDMLLRDPHDLLLPATLPPADYHVRLSLLSEDGQPVGQSFDKLTTLTTVDRPRTYEPPTPQVVHGANFNHQAELVGFDVSSTALKPRDVLTVTLHWQAINPFERSWKVFVHLLDDHGTPLTQQDHFPGDGQFLTPSWLPGEYLTDSYRLTIPAEAAPGEYTISLGFYDVNDFSRLPVVEGDTIVGDHVLLEAEPVVVR